MRLLSLLLIPLCLAAPAAAEGPGAAAPEIDRLLARTRLVYAQAHSFSPAALRLPLRRSLAADLAAALRAAEQAPEDLEAQWNAAELAEQAETDDAEALWTKVVALLDARLKKNPDPSLAERRVRALVGANMALQAVPAAEKGVAAQPGSWKAHLLYGDACLRRADFNWRVLVRLRPAKPELSSGHLLQMNGDLAACAKAYDRAVELAPAEPAPRGARMALNLARPVMASMLPKGAVVGAEKSDLSAIRTDLIDLVRVSPGQVAPLWLAARYFAAQPPGEAPLSMAERQVLEKGAADARPAGDDRIYLAEARGLLAFARQDWPEVRRHFEAALALAPDRAFAADWLAVAESRSPDPREQVLARARARLEAKPRAQDWTLAGILLAEENRAEAMQALRKALELDVDAANARYNLAVLMLRVYRSTTDARRHIERCLQLQPDNREAVFVASVMQFMDGDPKGARRSLEELSALPDVEPDLRKRVQQTLAELSARKP